MNLSLDLILMGTLGAIFVTHYLGGVAAFGSTLLALPALLLIGWETQPAVLLLLSAGSVQTITMAAMTWRGVSWRAYRKMLVLALSGIPIGLFIVDWIPTGITQGLLGVLLIFSSLSRFVPIGRRFSNSTPQWMLNGLAIMGGVAHAAFGAGGSTLTLYAHHTLPEKDVFRGTLTFILMTLNFAVVGGLLTKRSSLSDLGPLIVIASILIFVATILGNATSKRLSNSQFKSGVSILLGIAGIIMILRGIYLAL